MFDTSTQIRAKNIRKKRPWRISKIFTETQFFRKNNVIKFIAEWKTGSSCETKTTNFRNFFHWHIALFCSITNIDCNIDPSGIDKKTQSILLCQKFEFQHIFLNAVLHEKSDDQTYFHAGFVKNCFRKNVNVFRKIKINLLEKKVNKRINKKKWNLVHEFSKYL